jgi:hypothetical protein
VEELKRSFSQHNIGKQEGDSIKVDVEEDHKGETAKEHSVHEHIESVHQQEPETSQHEAIDETPKPTPSEHKDADKKENE